MRDNTRRPVRASVPREGPTPFLLRLPAALHRSLTQKASAAGLSLNEYCVRRLRGAEPSSELTLDVSALLDRAAAVTNDRVVGLISHGSAARGEASTSSDVDVLVIVEGGVPLTRDAYRRWDAEGADANDSNIDAHFVHLPEDPRSAGGVWCEAAIDGVVLADSRGLVARALRDVRRAISEGRLVRKTAHGQPYWTAA